MNIGQGPVVIDHGAYLEITWPEGRARTFECASELVEGWVTETNRMRGECALLRGKLDAVRADLAATRAEADRFGDALTEIAESTNDEHVALAARKALKP